MKLHFDKLNRLENEMHNILQQEIKQNSQLKSADAAKLCDVSTSKISKFVHKLGFINYRQYREFIISGELQPIKQQISELDRLSDYIKRFDYRKPRKLSKLISNYDRIVLYGFGPSLIAAEYFAYRLRINTNHDVVSTSDDFIVTSNFKKNTLLLIYTATGTFRSFEKIINICEMNNIAYLIICEEYNNLEYLENKNVLYLTDDTQENKQYAYDKTRTIWFIFIEEVISELQNLNT